MSSVGSTGRVSFATLALIFTSIALLGQTQTSTSSFEGDLPRSAALGFRTAPDGEGGLMDAPRLMVRSVVDQSAAHAAGLQAGDILTAIGSERIDSALKAFELLDNLPGDREIVLEIRRNGELHTLRFTPPDKPLENLEGVHTTYGVLRTDDGTPLRTLLTRPLGARGRLPAILLSDWTTCSSIEVPRPIDRGWINIVRGVVETTGVMVLRVDKPGVGDSLGTCSELDFDETIAYQRKALRQLKQRPDVDPEKIFLQGESVGSFMAPLVARGEDVAGIFVFGGGAPTWFERMVTFERKQRELSGRPLDEIDREMKRILAFFHYYLIQALPLETIFQRHPQMRRVWTEDISHNSATKHYGRPIAFHQQAQRHDFAAAWIETGAPGLVLLGEYDQFESEAGARTIVNALNRARPGNGTLIVYPNMNHQLELYSSREAALAGGDEYIVGTELVLADIRSWLNRILQR